MLVKEYEIITIYRSYKKAMNNIEYRIQKEKHKL